MSAKELLDTHKSSVQRLTQLADEAVAQTKKLDADHIKVSGSVEYEARLVVENKQFTLANSLRSQSLHVEVHKQNKKGSASINILESGSLQTALKQAATLASFSVPDKFLTLADHAQAPKTKQLGFMWDDSLASIDLGALQEGMQTALARMCKDPRVAVDRFETSISLSHSLMANSLGMSQGESQSTIDWSFMGMGREGDEVSGMDYDSGFSYQAKGWLDKCLAQIDQFTERVIRNLSLVNCPSYKGPVILSPRAVDDILFSIISFHMSGRAVMDGKSRWQDALGTKVFPDTITIMDDPHHPALSGSTAFDADGLPTKQQPLIDKGVLKAFVHDLYSAKRCHTTSNAMAGGPFGVVMHGGKTALAELQKTRSQMLYVERFSGNTDPLTGQFSGVAKSSYLLKDGKNAGAVNETMIAGNIFEAASSLLPSRETENVSGGAILPNLLIDGVSISAAK